MLEFVRAQHVVTANDLSRAMQMTEANARHHLNILMIEELVVEAGFRKLSGKGRPVKLYSLSEQALGHNLNSLSNALLDQLLAGLPSEQQAFRIRQLAKAMAERYLPKSSIASSEPGAEWPQSAHLTRRLYQAVRLLNLAHYEARWEAHTQAPRVILGRCPYAAIIEDQPALCQMDQYLLERLSGAAVQQTAKRQPDARGVRQCIFFIIKKGQQETGL